MHSHDGRLHDKRRSVRMADPWVELGVDHPPLVGGWVSYPVADRSQSLVDDFLVLRVSSSMVLHLPLCPSP